MRKKEKKAGGRAEDWVRMKLKGRGKEKRRRVRESKMAKGKGRGRECHIGQFLP